MEVMEQRVPRLKKKETSILSPEQMKKLYYYLLKTRMFDESNRKLFRQGRIPGTYFSGIGQEATTVVPSFLLKKGDMIGPSHREIGASVGRGMPLKLMTAHLMARTTGVDKGKCHPCHYGSLDYGVIIPASTVAAQWVLATGCALAFKIRKQDNIALAFTGEGGTSTGEFHEACNFAGVHKLPVVYIVQNNLWAESVPARLQAAITDFSDRAKAYGFPGITVDGNDVVAMIQVCTEAIQRARAGEGPTLIEAKTYRWHGHSDIDPADYRTKEEVEFWMKKDPIPRYEKHLVENKFLTEKEKQEIIASINTEIEEAIAFAESSPMPKPEDAVIKTDLYAPSPYIEDIDLGGWEE